MPKPFSGRNAVLLALTALGTLVAAVLGYCWWAPDPARLVRVELAGSAKAIRGLPDAQLSAAWADFLLIAGYGIALSCGAWLVCRLPGTKSIHRLARVAIRATWVAVALDIAEHALFLLVPNGISSGGRYAVAAQALAITKWSLITPAATVAALGIVTTMWRAAHPWRSQAELDLTVTRPASDADEVVARGGPDAELAASRTAWRAHTILPKASQDPGKIGICVSGGGIRSATFAFGALDAMRDVVTQARWLVSVSGGGYAAGAMRLALQQPDSVAQPADVYCAGTSELDYTRRHGRYLADSASEWLKLAVTVLRGFLVNMLILALLVVVGARVLAHGYALISVDLSGEGPSRAGQAGVCWAIGACVLSWLLLMTVSIVLEPLPPKVTGMFRQGAFWVLSVAGVVALTGVILPLLARVPFDVPWSTLPGRTTALPLQGVSVLSGYVAALIALGMRPSLRAAVGNEVKRMRGWWRTAGAGGRNLVATACVCAGLFLLLAGFVILFGAVLGHTGPLTAPSSAPGKPLEWKLTVGLAAALSVVALVDQVHWSLHGFYRRRLASAFAVRRIRDRGHVAAVAYDFDKKATDLHEYDTRVANFPEVVFSCAAHVSGNGVTPPGRRVMPWTMSATSVGGQYHGWIPTGDLHDAVSRTIKRDLTVQAAQAISGAAIASQMGVLQRTYTKLLTLSNIRLGSWLPNPAYLDSLPRDRSWVVPRLPRKRGLATLVRELTGSFPADGPLVYVTDGGHYENLGLVELLRRRPAKVYCVDASGDHGGVPDTLAAAIELAHEELGVDITFDNAAKLGAGPDQPGPVNPRDQLMAQVMPRLAPASVITGTIKYPDLGPDYPPSTAKIVLGKAVITPKTPFSLLAYASKNLTFPSDSTADQWFDVSQFDAYHSLGRHVGSLMMAQLPAPASVDQLGNGRVTLPGAVTARSQ
jgi:hypothetical protein